MSQIKIITLNVEMNRHFNDIIPFLEREAPDVLCLQEIFQKDLKILEDRFGYRSYYLPMCNRWYGPEDSPPLEDEGIAILTKLSFINDNMAYYYKASDELHTYNNITIEEKRATMHQGVLWGTAVKDGSQFNIANTHFTWTPDGKPNNYQDTDIKAMLDILKKIPDLVFCGDFNAPREKNHIYKILTEKFADNIPKDIKTTLDVYKHRACKDPAEKARISTYVVDYIFSTPKYKVSDVRCEFGVSDHAAIIGIVTENK